MAKWLRFTQDYDHRWPNRAVTAFKAGMVAFVKDEVADRALELKRAEETERPADNDPDHVTTRDPMESGREEAYGAADEEAPPADDRRPDGVDEPDDADDVGPGVRVSGDAPTRKRRRARAGG